MVPYLCGSVVLLAFSLFKPHLEAIGLHKRDCPHVTSQSRNIGVKFTHCGKRGLCIFFRISIGGRGKKNNLLASCNVSRKLSFFLLSVSYEPSNTWVGHGLLLLNALQLPCKSKLLQRSEAEQHQCKG